MAESSKPQSKPESSKPESNTAAHRAWAVSAERFIKASTPASAASRPPAPGVSLSSSAAQVQFEETGITWDPSAVVWSLLERSTVDRARARFRASLPEYIWDAAALEGNPYTLPEVQTLLEGITVTGHRIADQDQILALNDGFNLTDELVGEVEPVVESEDLVLVRDAVPGDGDAFEESLHLRERVRVTLQRGSVPDVLRQGSAEPGTRPIYGRPLEKRPNDGGRIP